MATKSGGGINSRNVKSVGVKTGQPRRKVSPRGTSQIGSSLGNHSTDRREISPNAVEKVFTGKQGISQPMGNTAAASTVCGPGGSRNLYGKSGVQGVHGSVNPGLPKPGNAGRGILNDYGRDSANVRGRR